MSAPAGAPADIPTDADDRPGAARSRAGRRRARVAAAAVVLAVAAIATAVALRDDRAAPPAGTPDLVVGPAQASVPVAGTSQLVLTVTNRGDGDDALVAASTDVALGVESHLTEITDGIATMRRVETVPLPADGTVRFRPGELHLMLIVPEPTLVAGSTFELTLTFARSPAVTVPVTVVDLLDLVEGADAGGAP